MRQSHVSSLRHLTRQRVVLLGRRPLREALEGAPQAGVKVAVRPPMQAIEREGRTHGAALLTPSGLRAEGAILPNVSRAFVKEDSSEPPLIVPRPPLPEGSPN